MSSPSIFAIRRGFFAGSGSAAFQESSVCDYVLQLTGKFSPLTCSLTAPVSIAYLGTATYDLEAPRYNQTIRFVERGCAVVNVAVSERSGVPPPATLQRIFSDVDIIVVSGGNTLYALRRWQEEGLVELIQSAAARGAVMTGGSAGAICWFDGGHSDSMDPETYKAAMLKGAAGAAPAGGSKDEASTLDAAQAAKPWSYIRVSGLGLLPGLVCPHHDRTQSNGQPRYADFDAMLLRHPGERGIAIDHWAALVITDDGKYHVFETPGKTGSCVVNKEDGSHGFVTDGSGRPAVWWKAVSAAKEPPVVVRHAVPFAGGYVADLLVAATAIAVDPREATCAAENPTTD